MDAGEGPGDDGGAAEVPRCHGGVLAAAALAVIPVADGGPTQAPGLVVAGDLGEAEALLAGDDVGSLAGLARVGVDGPQEGVVADVIEVATVGEPRARRRDVVRGAFTLGLDEDGHLREVPAVPSGEGF